MSPSSAAASILSGTITTPASAATVSSRCTCSEPRELREKMSTMTRDDLSASTMEAAHSAPGGTSRGATQQRTRAASSPAQTASATALSLFEYEMKTSCATRDPQL